MTSPEEADVERPDPEVEQVAAEERAAADPVFLSKLSIAMVVLLPRISGGATAVPGVGGSGRAGRPPPGLARATLFWCRTPTATGCERGVPAVMAGASFAPSSQLNRWCSAG